MRVAYKLIYIKTPVPQLRGQESIITVEAIDTVGD